MLTYIENFNLCNSRLYLTLTKKLQTKKVQKCFIKYILKYNQYRNIKTEFKFVIYKVSFNSLKCCSFILQKLIFLVYAKNKKKLLKTFGFDKLYYAVVTFYHMLYRKEKKTITIVMTTLTQETVQLTSTLV